MARNSDNFKELKTASQLKTELAKLKRENKAAYKTIDKLIAASKKKDEEISHLKSLLEQSVPVLIENKTPQKVIKIEMPPEEEIADLQLEKLRQTARKRSLTLEETRQYDLLVKNKRLSQEQSTINLDNSDYKKIDEAKLIEAATSDDESRSKNKR